MMYETDIAQILGKTVIPISQSINDMPSDLTHHRALIIFRIMKDIEIFQMICGQDYEPFYAVKNKLIKPDKNSSFFETVAISELTH